MLKIVKEMLNVINTNNIFVGISNSKSTYKEHGESSTAHSSNITANKDINITATKKDIDIKGSNITGENINLTAKENVNIKATENSSIFNSKETKRGKSAGASFSIYGTSAYANAYGMKEKGEGITITYTGSKVTANNELNITTGKDTNIKGSKASGEKVTANIGGNLNIESLQETEDINYKTSGSSISGTLGIAGDVPRNGSANIQANRSEMDSEYNSVTEQAGIYAGNKGFDINVAGNTDLKGAVIDSTAAKDKNTLNTGTLSFDDIQNKAEYETKGYGISYSGQTNEEKKQSGRPVMQGDKGLIPAIPMASTEKDDSTTKSAIADGTITIRNKEQQKQDINELKRNTKDTLNKLDKIFDKDKIEEKQELAGQFSELSFNALHEVSKNWSSEQKAMVHMAIGYISAEMAESKEPLSVALAAGVNKYVVEKLTESKPQKITLKDKDGNDITLNIETNKTRIYFNEHPEELQWISAAIGAGIGGMTGGGNSAMSGASISASGTKNNWGNKDVQFKQVIAMAKPDNENGYPHALLIGIDAEGVAYVLEKGNYAYLGDDVRTKMFSEDTGAIVETKVTDVNKLNEFLAKEGYVVVDDFADKKAVNLMKDKGTQLQELDKIYNDKTPSENAQHPNGKVTQDRIDESIQRYGGEIINITLGMPYHLCDSINYNSANCLDLVKTIVLAGTKNSLVFDLANINLLFNNLKYVVEMNKEEKKTKIPFSAMD